MSNKNSFKDWKFLEWFKGNWKTIQELVKVGVPFLLGLKFVSTNPVMILGITALGKFVLDVGHYYFTKQ